MTGARSAAVRARRALAARRALLAALLLGAAASAGCEAADLANPPDPIWTPSRGFVNDWSRETRDDRRR